MGNRLRGCGGLSIVGLSFVLLAGCGSASGSHERSTKIAERGAVRAPAAALRQVRQDHPSWGCAAMGLTSAPALAADVSANAAGDQFGTGSGPSAQADFAPASGRADGSLYAEFNCTARGRRVVIWYDDVGGVWLSMNGGLPIHGGLSASPTRITIPTSSRAQSSTIETSLANSLSHAFASAGAPAPETTCEETGDTSDEFYCVLKNTTTHLSILALYKVDSATGKVFSLNAGKISAGAQTEGASTASSGGSEAADSYHACSNTVASMKSMTVDLRTYLRNQSDATKMHDDFEALGLDLGLLARQVEGAGEDSDGVILLNAGAAYLADAEEVDISGQLQSPPDGFAVALRGSCPHSFAAAGLTGGGSSSGDTETGGSDSGGGGGTAESQPTSCGGPIEAPGGTTFAVDYHLGSCEQALAITRAYIHASSKDLGAGQLPGNSTVSAWKCSISLNNSKLVQFFCIGAASGQEVEGIVKQARAAAAPSGTSVVSALNSAFESNPPQLCDGGICRQDPACSVASATVELSQVYVGISCSALASSLTAAGTYGAWAVQSQTNSGGGTGCNLMGTRSLSSTDQVDVSANSGTSAADLCQALDASGDWTGQAG